MSRRGGHCRGHLPDSACARLVSNFEPKILAARPLRLAGHAEEACEDVTYEFLHTLLQRLVSEVAKVEWPEAEKAGRRQEALQFLLEQFKRYYLPVLFPGGPNNLPSKRMNSEGFQTSMHLHVLCYIKH